uniref:Gustatory receptor n=1 Tax=Globodera rostochiensis TaxID=31243 RepID=A0A914I0K9_GLORO
MGTSIVCLIVNSINWMAFAFGMLFNGIMIRLIVRHTPKPMRIYSKILLQTCLADIFLLIMTFLFQPYNFITEKGETEAIVYGLITFKGVENRIWNLLAFVCWVFLVYVSMFSYVSQFIFRYLLLVRNINLSTFKYFLLLCLMLLFPFAYCVNLFICYYPPADRAIMDDISVAQMLGINLSEQIVLAGYSFNDPRQTFGLYYVITVCTLAYIIMFRLAFLIQKFLENRTKMEASSELTQNMIEINKQVSRNLIGQASMPLIIYVSLLFLFALFLFKIDTNGWNWLHYYNLFSTIPMFLPSALNPIMSICIIHYYRNAIISDTKALGQKIKHFFGLIICQQSNESEQQQQQQQQPEKWAISQKCLMIKDAREFLWLHFEM